MICEKTGAQIHIVEYDLWAICDAYRSKDGTVIFRISDQSYLPFRDLLHYRVHEVGQWWDKDHLKSCSTLAVDGVAVSYFGYEGIDVNSRP